MTVISGEGTVSSFLELEAQKIAATFDKSLSESMYGIDYGYESNTLGST